MQDFRPARSPSSFHFKKEVNLVGKRLLLFKKLVPNCSKDREMDASTSAMVDGVAECVNGPSLYFSLPLSVF